jgi:hypothetical protein
MQWQIPHWQHFCGWLEVNWYKSIWGMVQVGARTVLCSWWAFPIHCFYRRNWCRWDKEVGFPLAQHWIEQSSSSSTNTLLIVQTWGMCCRVGLWGSCTTWQIRCTLKGRARDSKNYAGIVEPFGWIWCTCWCESNFRYQSHWEFRSSSVAALRACMCVTLGLEICS